MPRPADDPLRVVLDTLAELERLLPALQQDVLLLVTEAHFRGASWREIAGRLDRSKQTVHQRFQAQMHARRTHEVLRNDVASAHLRARAILLNRSELASRDDVDESAAFLREVAAHWRPTAGATPSVSGAGRG